jgi:hypothetical protein
MTQLSRLAKLGMAIEVTPGTYLAPTFSVPFTKASYETMQDPLRDESVRANDSVLQGLYAGPSHSTWDIETHVYPDLIGFFLRFIGPDTVTAATATTLSSPSTIGATSISTAATIPAGSVIRIDTAANTEYAITGTPSGVGPFTIPITTPATGLTIAHSTSVAVTTQTTHTFKQTTASRPPSYSITVNDVIDTRGWTFCTMSDLGVKIDPKGTVTFNPKFAGFPEALQSTFTPAYTILQPLLGWQWTMTNAGGSSTRGLTYDLALKRPAEVIHSSDGTQTPREVFSGALESDATYKAIYESVTDMNLFLNYTQSPTTATMTQPPQAGGVQLGGASLALTMSQSGWLKAMRDLSQTYVQATFNLSGIQNTTDGGIIQAVLKNFTTTQY